MAHSDSTQSRPLAVIVPNPAQLAGITSGVRKKQVVEINLATLDAAKGLDQRRS